MIWIPVAFDLLSATIHPAYVFPGETAAIRLDDPAVRQRSTLYAVQNLDVRPSANGWTARPRAAAPARFTVLLSEGSDPTPIDGTVFQVPVALSAKPNERAFLAFTNTERGRCDLIRTTAGDALLLKRAQTEFRTLPLLIADVAVRFAPQRPREFVAEYFYGLGKHLTLLGRPGGIAHVAIYVEWDHLRIEYLARYRQEGALRICGVAHPIQLEAGERTVLTLPLSDLKGSTQPASH
jgi:hypothetical protein